MQALHKSIRSLCVLIPVLALAGCQKGSDADQPAAAVAGPRTEKADSQVAITAPVVVSDQDPQHPIYEFQTSQGRFVVQLDAEKAPLTVDNFRNYVSRGYYNSTIFHQVIKSSLHLALGGGYTADLKEKTPQTPIRNEADRGLKNRRGTIAMARRPDDEDSATCQFFINVADNDNLNFKSRTPAGYGYCAFGEVTEGMDVLERIANAPVHDSGTFKDLPVETIVINSVRQLK